MTVVEAEAPEAGTAEGGGGAGVRSRGTVGVGFGAGGWEEGWEGGAGALSVLPKKAKGYLQKKERQYSPGGAGGARSGRWAWPLFCRAVSPGAGETRKNKTGPRKRPSRIRDQSGG